MRAGWEFHVCVCVCRVEIKRENMCVCVGLEAICATFNKKNPNKIISKQKKAIYRMRGFENV